MMNLRLTAAIMIIGVLVIPFGCAIANDSLTGVGVDVVPRAGELDGVADVPVDTAVPTLDAPSGELGVVAPIIPPPFGPQNLPDWPKDELTPPPGSE